MKNIFRVIVFVAFFAIGIKLTINSMPSVGLQRSPSAIRQSYDFSHLTGSALESAMKERMVSKIQIYKSGKELGLSLGHFAILDHTGQKVLGCREYSKVIYQFEAEGVAYSGVKPKLELEGSCEFSEDLSTISPIYLPMSRILAEKPADGEFDFRDGKRTLVRFEGINEMWPRKWVLVGVKMSGNQSGYEISVDKSEVSKILGHPVMLSFE